MQVGVGFSDNPDTSAAGLQAARETLTHITNSGPCDLIFLFTTARHDPEILQKTVASVLGEAPIVGGGALGSITNDKLGYAGDEVGLAAVWLEGIPFSITAQPGLDDSVETTGRQLGRRLADSGVGKDTPVILFYDAVGRPGGGLRSCKATPLLDTLGQGLGFSPNLAGAGLQGDIIGSAMQQWTGAGLGRHQAVAVAFGTELRIDSFVMHGCRPATAYYTVTGADDVTILEVNGEPALPLMKRILGPAIPPEDIPFFLTLGINKNPDPWAEFNEANYAMRLCLAIDTERDGLVMAEPDMVKGTRFQIMHRELDVEYVGKKFAGLCTRHRDRRPVFALYINCAGRAAGYAGTNHEDAAEVRRCIGDIPFLGIYSCAEIASVGGAPRALDWTGVFCLFSVPHA